MSSIPNPAARQFRSVGPAIILYRHVFSLPRPLRTVLFYNPEDPPLMPLEASQALHRSQIGRAHV